MAVALAFLACCVSELQVVAAVHFRGAGQQVRNLDPNPWIERIAAYNRDNVALNAPATAGQVVGDVPSIFVSVFSRVDGVERRALIRDMWLRAQRESGNASLTYKFAVCGANNMDRKNALTLSLAETRAATLALDDEAVTLDNINDTLFQDLVQEQSVHNDVMYLNCEEGYGEGALTRKVLASTNYFLERTQSQYFMKIDDDSFLSWTRYAPLLHLKSEEKNGLYMGILVGEAVPCRQKDFRWYEPYENFPDALFPKGMSGGSGYTIDRKLVETVHKTGLGDGNILWNEDRAVGLWMSLLNQSGMEVDYVNMKGIDGFWAWDWEHPKDNWATWRDYKGIIVHHGLEGETIRCLAHFDNVNDKSSQIDGCFDKEVGKYYEPLKCAELNKDAMKNDPAQQEELRKAAEVQKEAANQEAPTEEEQ